MVAEDRFRWNGVYMIKKQSSIHKKESVVKVAVSVGTLEHIVKNTEMENKKASDFINIRVETVRDKFVFLTLQRSR